MSAGRQPCTAVFTPKQWQSLGRYETDFTILTHSLVLDGTTVIFQHRILRPGLYLSPLRLRCQQVRSWLRKLHPRYMEYLNYLQRVLQEQMSAIRSPNTRDSPSPTKRLGGYLHAASASDYGRGHRSWQAPFPCPGRARKRQALYPHYTYAVKILLEYCCSTSFAARSYSTQPCDS